MRVTQLPVYKKAIAKLVKKRAERLERKEFLSQQAQIVEPLEVTSVSANNKEQEQKLLIQDSKPEKKK